MKKIYLFANQTYEQIEKTLYQKINSSLKQKYGSIPDLKISNQIRDEWILFKKLNVITDIAILTELTTWLKSINIPYSARYSCNASIIFYLLGISKTNPLQPHYYCPKCHKIAWIQNSERYLNTPKKKICSDDNNTLIAEGSSIPFKYFFNDYRQEHIFTLYVPIQTEKSIINYFKSHWYFPYADFTLRTQEQYLSNIVHIRFSNIEIFCKLNQTTNNIKTNNFSDSNFKNHLKYHQQQITLYKHSLDVEIINFDKLISYLGILNATYSDDSIIETQINMLKHSPRKLIAFREDLFKYFLSHNISEKDAFRATEHIRKGKKSLEKTLPADIRQSLDDQLLTLCSKIDYLPTKTEILADLMINDY